MTQALSEILKNTGVAEETLEAARRTQAEKGGSLGDILIAGKAVTERQWLEALAAHYVLPLMPVLPLENIQTDLIEKFPIQFLKKHGLMPLETKSPEADDASKKGESGHGNSGQRLIAIHALESFQQVDDLARILGWDDYQVVLSTREQILSAINLSYDRGQHSAEQLVQDMEENGSTIITEIEDTADLLEDTSDAPIIKLVNHMLSQAIKARASDIHIEPYQNTLKVRYRVDGILYDLLTPPKWIQPSLISRIKVMARLNIAEKRLPQDGRIEVKKGEQDIDIRVSTLPTTFGERVVLRLLNKTGSILRLTDLGLMPDKLKMVRDLIRSPHGIILITGPTGSGKTTTLYAILAEINTTSINIITIEDPVEYQIQGIGQIQVNPKIDLTFARGLRSIVRQDPDVILIGEIRDPETAEIAVQSALTGHLVFSTLHTNDSASAITRLVDIGLEPFLISSSVLAVAAQRLIRVLCKNCKAPYVPDELALESIGLRPDQFQGHTTFQARGCEKCFNTGYRGRIGIFEFMTLDATIKKMILKTHDANQIKDEALRQKMGTLRMDGIRKVLQGITTIEEVLRVS